MRPRPRVARWLAAAAALFLLHAHAAAAPPKLTGGLAEVHGVRVLRLSGSAYERGYAHGYLLADDIMYMLEACVLDPRVMQDTSAYEQKICGRFLSWMDFGEPRMQELTGMRAGIAAAAGPEGIRLERLHRDLEVKDLQAINTLADWAGFFCSSFSAWGDLTADGEMITARNLDYLSLQGLRDRHVIIVHGDPGEGRMPWVSVAWPGLIGAYTAMNADGVTISIHDSNGLPAMQGGPFTPRSLVLREAIEQASGASPVADVEKILRASRVIVANNVHVSGPTSTSTPPAAVFELDGDRAKTQGVTMRLAADNKTKSLTQAVMCTNHYRKRGRSVPCDRFATMQAALTDVVREGRKVDVDAAQRILRDVSVSGTLQSVVFLPNRKAFHLGLAAAGKTGAEVEAPLFKLSELIR